jgi:hypothetical protein
MPPAPETDAERRDREVAELKARAQRLEGLVAETRRWQIGLGAVVVWAVFFRESPRHLPRGRAPAPLVQRSSALDRLPQKGIFE